MAEERTLRYTVAPDIDSKIVMKRLPGAACTLHREDDTNPTHSLKLYADQDGMISFHVTPVGELEILTKLVVDCEVGGNIRRRFPLELRTSLKATPEMPFPGE